MATIHKLSGTDELNDLRFTVKKMANLIDQHHVRSRQLPSPPPWGRFPFKKVNTEIIDGNPTLHELNRWYRYAPNLLRKGDA